MEGSTQAGRRRGFCPSPSRVGNRIRAQGAPLSGRRKSVSSPIDCLGSGSRALKPPTKMMIWCFDGHACAELRRFAFSLGQLERQEMGGTGRQKERPTPEPAGEPRGRQEACSGRSSDQRRTRGACLRPSPWHFAQSAQLTRVVRH